MTKAKQKFELKSMIMNLLFYLIVIMGLPIIIFSYLNIKISQTLANTTIFILMSILVIYSTLLIKSNYQEIIRNIKENILEIGFVFTSLLISFYGKVLPILYEKAPILHDPLSHSAWADSILERGRISYYYSPYLHSIIATIESLGITSAPYALNLISFLSSFLLPILLFIIFQLAFKSRKISYTIFFVTLLSPFPTELTYTAGKNALIFGIFASLFTIYYSIKYLNEKKSLNFINLCISLLIVFLVHYPTFIIICVFLSVFVAHSSLRHLFKRDLVKALIIPLPFILSGVLSILWWIHISEAYRNFKNSVIAEGLEIKTNVDYSQGFIGLAKESLSYTNDLLTGTLDTSYILLLLIFVIPIIFNKSLKRLSSIYWIVVVNYLLIFSIVLFRLDFASLTMKTDVLIFNYIIIISSAFIIASLFNKYQLRHKYALVVIVPILIVFNIRLNRSIHNTYNRFRVITNEDLEAFDYIEKNIDSNELIINSAIKPESKNIVYPSDGGAWIPSFTSKEIAFDFREFNYKKTHATYTLYEDLINNDIDDNTSINELKKLGYRYIYIDQGVFAEGLKENHLQNVDYEIVFENDIVKILKLN